MKTLEIKNLNKHFYYNNKTHHVFQNLNLSLEKGQNIAIMGRNGSGKSTLINMIGGIDAPNSGQITAGGSISWPVGFSGSFQGSLSARENISFICRIYGFKGKEIYEKCQECKEIAEIGDFFESPVKLYSSGMKARVSFALSMAFDFDLYLLDEVTATGDKFFIKKARQMLFDKMSRSNFIMVSHNVGDIKELCNIFGVIYNKNVTLFDSFKDANKFYQETSK